MSKVRYCTNSTITEAWATVLGMPTPFLSEESAGLILAAKKKINGLSDIPTLAINQIEKPDQPVAPFWNRQVSWNRRQFLARVGHRYLSVHFLSAEDCKYRTYADSFTPGLDAWLEVFQDFYGDQITRSGVKGISYGYVNQFRFPAENFDLSEKFKLNIGVQMESAAAGLAQMDLRFGFQDFEGASISVQVAVAQDQGDSESLGVTTKVAAEFATSSMVFLNDRDSIRREILRAKETAKRVFFEIASESTHELMGAQYVTG